MPQWSCCLATKQDSIGCIDDHSVGIKSALGNIRSQFLNKTVSLSTLPRLNQSSSRPQSSLHNRSFNSSHQDRHHDHRHSQTHTNSRSTCHHSHLAGRNPSFERGHNVMFKSQESTTSSTPHQQLEQWNESTPTTSRLGVMRELPMQSLHAKRNRPMSSPGGFRLFSAQTTIR
jgi:hypothetical protein